MGKNEIERKFLLETAQLSYIKEQATVSKSIKQSYLAIDKQREVRLRQLDGNEIFLTVKSSGKLSREEIEIELTEEQSEAMLGLLEDEPVEKTRYQLQTGEQLIEVDEYRGKLRGLLVAEVEFVSERQANEFIPPSWFGKEVTDDSRFKNKNLIAKCYEDLPL